jgi:purine-nucleoside phosphorylase
LPQQLGKLASCVEQTCAHRQDRCADDVSNFSRREPFQLVQHEDGAFLFRQLVEKPLKGDNSLLARQIFVGRQAWIGLRVLELRVHELRTAARRPAVHEHHVDCYAMQPGRELGLSAEVFEATVDLEKDLLDQILEVDAWAGHAKDEPRHFRSVKKKELTKCGRIPPLAARDDFVDVGHSTKASPNDEPVLGQKGQDYGLHFSGQVRTSSAAFTGGVRACPTRPSAGAYNRGGADRVRRRPSRKTKVRSAMPSADQLDALVPALVARSGVRPTVGVVLGSGLGAFGEQLEHRIAYEEIPGMPVARVPGHSGYLRFGGIDGIGVACLQGRVHLYEGYPPEAVVFGVRLLAALGCRAVLLTNAAGGIGPGLSPGDRLLVTDHLNLTGKNPLIGAREEPARTQFVDMQAAYDPRLRDLAHAAARELDIPLKQGVYAGLLGPSYETPAEIRMLRALGADAVGMSTVLEVIALRQRGVKAGAISCITNLAAGISAAPIEHGDVQAIAQATSAPFVALLTRWTALVGNELSA